MKKWICIIAISTLILACQRKAIAISNSLSESPKGESSADSNNILITKGETIYTNRCGRCHSLKNTYRFSVEDWNAILPVMIKKAGLTEAEAGKVPAYVLSH